MYPSIHCPLSVGDSQETQEREGISRVSPINHTFLTSGSHPSMMDINEVKIKPYILIFKQAL
jgi:hypothetical protein